MKPATTTTLGGIIIGDTLQIDSNNVADVAEDIANHALGIWGTSTTAAATVEKTVSIPTIKSLKAGQLIIVSPTITSTVANSTLKLNNFDAYPMYYNNAAITTSTDSIVWNAAYPTLWLFNGARWVFVAHGVDSNTTYGTMSVAEGIAGTATSARTLTAANLKQIILGAVLSDIDFTTAAAVTDADDIITALGKLQAQITEHGNDTTVHITAAERDAWNAKQAAMTAGFGIDITNGVISLLGEIDNGGVAEATDDEMDFGTLD